MQLSYILTALGGWRVKRGRFQGEEQNVLASRNIAQGDGN